MRRPDSDAPRLASARQGRSKSARLHLLPNFCFSPDLPNEFAILLPRCRRKPLGLGIRENTMRFLEKDRMARRACIISLAGLVAALAVPATGYGALASGGKATTSSNLSTNPTIRRQQLLCDPAVANDPIQEVRLDIQIVIEPPPGTPTFRTGTAQDFIERITVIPYSTSDVPDPFQANAYEFVAASAMPQYGEDGIGSSATGITFSGNTVTISNVHVIANGDIPEGDVNFALVEIEYEVAKSAAEAETLGTFEYIP